MMAKRILILVILVFTVGSATAQKLGMTDRLSGTYVVSFKTAEGKVKVFLPDDMSGGDTVSAAVLAFPAPGKGPVLNSYKIHTDYKSAEVSSGRITLNIPSNMSGSSLRVTLRDQSGREISYSSAAVKLPDAFANRPEMPTPFDFETPLVGQTGRLAEIRGPFDGDFSTTQLTIGGRQAHVISESPRKLVFEVPPATPGQAEVVLIEKGVTVKRPFTALRVVKIGEGPSATPQGIVPEGYRAGAQPSPAAVKQEVTADVVEEVVVIEQKAPEPGLIEEDLDVVTEEVGIEEKTEILSEPSSIRPSEGVAQILDAQLNVPLEGAANLVKAEVIDTVVVRELDVSEEKGTSGQGDVRVSPGEIIEEDILEEEIVIPDNKEISPASTASGDASESSRDLIERIYESTRDDLQETPQSVSRPKEQAVSKSPSQVKSYGGKGKYTVQVASFRQRAAANGYARELERKGYKVRVTEADVPGKGRWSRVSVGSFDTKEQAKAYGERIKRQEPAIKSVYITTVN